MIRRIVLIALLILATCALAPNNTYAQRLGRWVGGCEIDAITDEQKCMVYYAKKVDGDLYMLFVQRHEGSYMISAVDERVLNQSTIRIDKNKPVKSSFEDKNIAIFLQADSLVKQIRSGLDILVRFTRYSGGYKDIIFPTDFFGLAMNQAGFK